MAQEKTSSSVQKRNKQNIDFERLKQAWEKIQQIQARVPVRKSKISLVEKIKDENGNEHVKVHMSDGGSFNDIGDKKELFKKMMPKRPNIGRLLSLLDAVRMFGFPAVAGRLPSKLKRILAHLCKKNGIPFNPRKKNNQKQNNASQPDEQKSLNLLKNNSKVISSDFPSVPITSGEALNVALQQQKQANNIYLKDRLQRCQREIKEEFFDSLRKELAETEKAKSENKQLNENQKTILNMARFYGISINKNEEKPSPEQNKHRKELEITSLPAKFQKKLTEKTEHYESICAAKNKATEAVCSDLKHNHYLCHTPINISQKELAEKAASLLPPPAQRNKASLKAVQTNFQEQIRKNSHAVKALRQQQKENAKNIFRKIFSPERKTPLNKKLKDISNMQRKSFTEHAVIHNLIKKRLLSY